MIKKIVSLALCVCMAGLAGCVDQHPEESRSADSTAAAENVRLIATSPAAADICDKLELDLVGVCKSSISTIPSRYDNATQVGMAMSPDVEIVKSLDPDWVISPSTLQGDLQPKYAGIGVQSIFLNLKSVEGMYQSIDDLGLMFGKEEQAKKLTDEYNRFISEYKSKNEGRKSPKVLVLMGLPGSYIIATESSYVGSLVKLAGGENVYGDGDGKEFLNVNTEDIYCYAGRCSYGCVRCAVSGGNEKSSCRSGHNRHKQRSQLCGGDNNGILSAAVFCNALLCVSRRRTCLLPRIPAELEGRAQPPSPDTCGRCDKRHVYRSYGLL